MEGFCFRFWRFAALRADVRPIQPVMRMAGEQDGAVSEAQMRECGLTARAQRKAVACGQLLMVEARVAVVVGSPDTWHRRLRVGLLALGPDAWVSHEAAAALHRLDRTLFEPLDFTVPRSARRTTNAGRVHTTDCVGALDVVTIDGFRCSSATRTIIDLAYLGIPPIRLAAAIDSSVHRGLSATRVLADRLAELRGPGRNGVAALDRLMPDTGGESPLERTFLGLLRRNQLPRPTTQLRIRRANGAVARVDFIYEALRVVVEVSGRKGHASDAERQRDAQRRNELTDQGYRVYEYTRGDIEDRPAWVVATMLHRVAASATAHVD